jgi:hypothetical protein
MPNKFGNYFAIVGAVALVKGKLKNSKLVSKVDKHLDGIIQSKNLIEKEIPFSWIGLIYRYGSKNDLNLDFQRIDKKDGELPIALELDMEILQWADQNNLDLLHDIFMIAALEALIQVCDKYKLPKEAIIAEREKYGNIPNAIEECENYGK